MGGATEVVRLLKCNQPTNLSRTWRQRCDRLHLKLIHPATEPSERPAHHLPRRQSRFALSVSRTLFTPRHDVSVGSRCLDCVNTMESCEYQRARVWWKIQKCAFTASNSVP